MPAELASTDLTGPQMQAVRALLAGAGPREVSLACGVSERTLRAWTNLPAFRAGLLQGQARLLEETALQLTLAATTAIQTLVHICENPAASPSVRVAAAGKLLTLAFRNAPTGLPAEAESSQPARPAAHPDTRLGLLLERLTDAARPESSPPPPSLPVSSVVPQEQSQPTSLEPEASAGVSAKQADSTPSGMERRGIGRREAAAETPVWPAPVGFEPLPDASLWPAFDAEAEADGDLTAFTLPLDSGVAASELARLLRSETADIPLFRIGRPQNETAAATHSADPDQTAANQAWSRESPCLVS